MSDQRGLSLIELLVGSALATVVAAALFGAYLATTRSLGESSAQAALQRQGSLALDEIARQVRGATGAVISTTVCNGHPNTMIVRTIADNPAIAADVCYYGEPSGRLCEVRNQPGPCRDLLAGGLTRIVLLTQTTPPDPRCLPSVPAGAPCFSVTRHPTRQGQVDVDFAVRDDNGDLDGRNVMRFAMSVACTGRNC